MATEQELRNEVVRASRHLYRRGLLCAYEGNVSVRLPGPDEAPGHTLLVTPTRRCKGELLPQNLVLLGAEGQVIGEGQASTESPLHVGIYQHMPSVCAVVHAHAPYTTAFACTPGGLQHMVQPELLVLLGGSPPMAPYAPPGSSRLFDSVKDLLQQSQVILLERHGVVATSTRSVMDAVYLVEQVEQVARISWLASQLGSLPALDPDEQAALVRGRIQADGLA